MSGLAVPMSRIAATWRMAPSRRRRDEQGERAGRLSGPCSERGKEVPEEVQEGQSPACAARGAAGCSKDRSVFEKGPKRGCHHTRETNVERKNHWNITSQDWSSGVGVGSNRSQEPTGETFLSNSGRIIRGIGSALLRSAIRPFRLTVRTIGLAGTWQRLRDSPSHMPFAWMNTAAALEGCTCTLWLEMLLICFHSAESGCRPRSGASSAVGCTAGHAATRASCPTILRAERVSTSPSM